MRSSTNSTNRKATRWAALAGAVVMMAAGLVAVQLVAAAPASAVTGLQYVSVSSPINSVSPKTVRAYCPPTKHVISGGGHVAEMNWQNPTLRMALTQLQPVERLDGTRDGYIASAAETPPGTTGDWYLVAYAMCADKNTLDGYNYDVIYKTTSASLDPNQDTAVDCPGAQVVLGTGASIGIDTNSAGRVVLQIARASADGAIARAEAHANSNVTNVWAVAAFAVCVDRLPGYEVRGERSEEELSESVKYALAECSEGRRVLHGAGGAISNVAPGNVSLQVVYPGTRYAEVYAVENTPLNQNWDFIVAQAICAY